MNAFFSKARQRRWTWRGSDGYAKHGIDYITFDKTYLVTDTGSDHRKVSDDSGDIPTEAPEQSLEVGRAINRPDLVSTACKAVVDGSSPRINRLDKQTDIAVRIRRKNLERSNRRCDDESRCAEFPFRSRLCLQ
ncbi:hypothetical protein Trydic_g16153 [Trypoxylus dichotomus]